MISRRRSGLISMMHSIQIELAFQLEQIRHMLDLGYEPRADDADPEPLHFIYPIAETCRSIGREPITPVVPMLEPERHDFQEPP